MNKRISSTSLPIAPNLNVYTEIREQTWALGEKEKVIENITYMERLQKELVASGVVNEGDAIHTALSKSVKEATDYLTIHSPSTSDVRSHYECYTNFHDIVKKYME